MAANGTNTKQVAVDLQETINKAREQKKNQALVSRIFEKGRRSSTPQNGAATGAATGAGIKKQRAVSSKGPRHSTGDVDGEWTHDLHGSPNPKPAAAPKPGSLASRISNPNLGPSANPRQKRRAAQVAQALIRTELQQPNQQSQKPQQQPQQRGRSQQPRQPQSSFPSQATATPNVSFNQGLTIKGLAGPFVVLAQNFAPGTTAADIESAMTPVGGIIERCRLVKTHPIVVAEIVFENKEGAERAIATFNGQTADGRVLQVFAKPGNTPTPDSQLPAQAAPTAPRAMRREEEVIDGSLGWDDPMETEDAYPNGNGRQPPRGPAADTGGLYSDSLVRTNRRGRGFARGGRY